MPPLPETAPLLAALHAVRRRVRLQAALDGAAVASIAAAAVALIGVYLHLLDLLPPRGPLLVAAIAGAILVGGALAAALRSLSLARIAKRVDATHRLADRLGSALEFSALPERTPFMDAAIADARDACTRVDPTVAARFYRPPHLGVSTMIGGLAALLLLFRFPVAAVPIAVAPPAVPRLAVDKDLLEPERDLARELQREALDSGDEELKSFAEELNKLFDQLDRRELTRKELFEKLAELEKKALAGDHGDFDELKEKLKKAGDELSKDTLTKEAGKALQQAELAKAKKELEELAKKIEQMKMSEQQREKLARALDNASKEQKSAAEQKAAAEERKLKEEQRRLQREQQKDPKNQETQRRLQRNERQLQELKRQQEQRQSQAQRNLQRMQREMQQAGQQMRQQNSSAASQAMQNAANQLGKMEQEYRKLGNMQQAQSAVSQLREMMRRMGQGQQANQDQQGKGEGQHGEAVSLREVQVGQEGDKGKEGQGKGQQGQKGEKMKDFLSRAKGQGDSKGPKLFMPGQTGENGEQLLMPMGQLPGQGSPGNGPDSPSGQPGDGVGNSHDPNMKGDSTRLAARRKELQAEAKQGAGPSRSETILGSAEKGFASTGYRRVYGDYTSVVEEVMSKEQVPPGYRFYVKRYFQLIKPRE